MLRLSSSRERWSEARADCTRYQAAAPAPALSARPIAAAAPNAPARDQSHWATNTSASAMSATGTQPSSRQTPTTESAMLMPPLRAAACTSSFKQPGLQLGELDRVVRQAGEAGGDVGLGGVSLCRSCLLPLDEPSE